MDRLKKFKLGDEISTNKWNSNFIVEVIYKGYIVAVNRRSKINPIFLFIKTYSNEVYFGSSRFLKYGCNNKDSIKSFVDMIVRKEFILSSEYCIPSNLILLPQNFDIKEKREMIREESYRDEYRR